MENLIIHSNMTFQSDENKFFIPFNSKLLPKTKYWENWFNSPMNKELNSNWIYNCHADWSFNILFELLKHYAKINNILLTKDDNKFILIDCNSSILKPLLSELKITTENFIYLYEICHETDDDQMMDILLKFINFDTKLKCKNMHDYETFTHSINCDYIKNLMNLGLILDGNNQYNSEIVKISSFTSGVKWVTTHAVNNTFRGLNDISSLRLCNSTKKNCKNLIDMIFKYNLFDRFKQLVGFLLYLDFTLIGNNPISFELLQLIMSWKS